MSGLAESTRRGSTDLALKAGAWYVASNFIGKGLTFITTPIFARMMSDTAYGEFSNFASWQVILCLIVGMELFNTLNRAYYDHAEDFDPYVSSVTALSLLLSTLFYAVALLLGEHLFKIITIPHEFVHILFLSAMFHACKDIFLARERVLYRYQSVALISMVNLIVPTLLAILLVSTAPQAHRLGARIYGFYIPASLIGCICAAIHLFRGKAFRFSHCRYALRLSLPLLLHYLTAYLLASANVIITKAVLGAASAAVVSIATSAVHIVTILLQSLSGAVTTWLMDNLEQKRFDTVRRGLLFYVFGIAFFSAAVIMVTPELIWILGGDRYAAAAKLLPGLILSAAIQSMGALTTMILTYQKRVGGTALCTAIVALLSLAAKVLLMPVFGIQMLIWINVAAFFILFVCGYLFVRHAGPYAQVIRLDGFFACMLGLLAVTLLSEFLFRHTVLRWSIIAAVAAAVLIVACRNRTRLAEFLKKRKK